MWQLRLTRCTIEWRQCWASDHMKGHNKMCYRPANPLEDSMWVSWYSCLKVQCQQGMVIITGNKVCAKQNHIFFLSLTEYCLMPLFWKSMPGYTCFIGNMTMDCVVTTWPNTTVTRWTCRSITPFGMIRGQLKCILTVIQQLFSQNCAKWFNMISRFPPQAQTCAWFKSRNVTLGQERRCSILRLNSPA